MNEEFKERFLGLGAQSGQLMSARINCIEAELANLKSYNERLQMAIVGAHVKALPENWMYSGPLETIDLLVAEILPLRKERDDLRNQEIWRDA